MSECNQYTLELDSADPDAISESRVVRDRLHGRDEDDDTPTGFEANKQRARDDEDDTDDESEDTEPMKVGGVYNVELSYSVTYRTKVVAESEHFAKKDAEDELHWGSFQDGHQTWSEIDELKEVFEDDELADELEYC